MTVYASSVTEIARQVALFAASTGLSLLRSLVDGSGEATVSGSGAAVKMPR